MPSAKRVLIVDDNRVNCSILSRILEGTYETLIAQNGKEAMELIANENSDIAAVMLDLVMPVMDGYEFLKKTNQKKMIENIPVIVVTGNGDRENESEALRLGAWDFVSKPYDAEIIRFRLKNALDRSQLTAFYRLKYLAEYDTLTDIYNQAKFFDATRQMLDTHTDKKFSLIYFDIDRFSLINSFFGNQEGNKVLKYIACSLKTIALKYELFTFGRVNADKFICCMSENTHGNVHTLVSEICSMLKAYPLNYDIVPSVGIYEAVDVSMSVDNMQDCARLAAKSVKCNYMDNVAVFNKDMRVRIENEQKIINDMNIALQEKQFAVYVQPKRRLENGELAGGEALVRWIHPEKGLLLPREFVPIFEQNGFIAKLDYYMWEMVCSYLQDWLQRGLSPEPVSVNISRVNLYNPHLVEDICDLTVKYQIPHALLNLEMTESACVGNMDILRRAIDGFRKEGFLVMMDDFGSAYSSLNTLKDIEVDVLKIDMEFFSKSDSNGRAKSIITSVVKMAKRLNIVTIAEGVESAEQEEFLRSLGCEYAQGYFVSPPLPKIEYEKLILNK